MCFFSCGGRGGVAKSFMILFFYFSSSMAHDLSSSNAFRVSPKELIEIISTTGENLLVDVRDKIAFDSGHYSRSINIDRKSIDFVDQIKLLQQQEKKRKLILVCSSGLESRIAWLFLRQNGVDNIFYASALMRCDGAKICIPKI